MGRAPRLQLQLHTVRLHAKLTYILSAPSDLQVVLSGEKGTGCHRGPWGSCLWTGYASGCLLVNGGVSLFHHLLVGMHMLHDLLVGSHGQ